MLIRRRIVFISSPVYLPAVIIVTIKNIRNASTTVVGRDVSRVLLFVCDEKKIIIKIFKPDYIIKVRVEFSSVDLDAAIKIAVGIVGRHSPGVFARGRKTFLQIFFCLPTENERKKNTQKTRKKSLCKSNGGKRFTIIARF